MDDLVIPRGHWRQPQGFDPDAFIPSWERRLRETIKAQPDPAQRFTNWLAQLAAGENLPGARLIFLEQPYLGWAEAVEEVIKTTEKNMRKQIAAEVEYGPGD